MRCHGKVHYDYNYLARDDITTFALQNQKLDYGLSEFLYHSSVINKVYSL